MTHVSRISSEPRARSATLPAGRPGRAARRPLGLVAGAAGLAAVAALLLWSGRTAAPPPPAPPPPHVTVAAPLRQAVAPNATFLGQFSAVDQVELRAQVGGTLTAIGFRDGQIVHRGDLLFTIDPRPYQVRLAQATAQLQTAGARQVLTGVQLWRARQLKRTDYGTAETVDQRAADDRSAAASIDAGKAAVADAALDLEFSRITAPFTGKVGAHQVSVGGLVAGSRGGTSPTTLLTTLVSLDPIYLDFDMSEAEYIAYRRTHPEGAAAGDAAISLDGDGQFSRHGTLDFIDNAVNRGSGTIHARVTVPNPDLSLTPGEFARLRVVLGKPAPVLLVPATSIVPDQSRELVMTVGADGRVLPKPVTTGPLYRGLREIRAGLAPNDRVIVDGLMLARPGSPVQPQPGTIQPASDIVSE